MQKKNILIPVMGPTGCGKSYICIPYMPGCHRSLSRYQFINTLLKKQIMKVGTDADSCTTELGFGCIEEIKGYPDYRIVLVDTPGLDNTYEGDDKILERIATGIKESYKSGAKLAGVIYLHDISLDRLSGTARRNLQMFKILCGDDALKNVVLGTTKWGRNSEHSEKREAQLKSSYWKPLIEKGSVVCRFDHGYESAQVLLEAVVSKVDEHKPISLIGALKIGRQQISRKITGVFRRSKG